MKNKQSSYYKSWSSMKERCLNPNNKDFYRYGGRGIKICDRWMKYKNFIEDMGYRPQGCEIDRIDNSKGYEPGNCRWVDRKTNARNKENNLRIELDGTVRTLSEWSEITGIGRVTLKGRLESGWTVKQALGYQVKDKRRLNRRRKLEYNGQSKSVEDWAKEFNLTRDLIFKRLGRGWSVEKTLETTICKNMSRKKEKEHGRDADCE